MSGQAGALPFTFVIKAEEVPAGGQKCVEVEGRKVLVLNTGEGQYRAVENICSHEKKPLEGGRVRGGKRIVCPQHGANFDLETGKALSAPAVRPITVFPVKLEGDSIYVQLIAAPKPPSDPFAIPGVKGF